jgi:hypothetical protein
MKTIRLCLFSLLAVPALLAFPPTPDDAAKPTPRVQVTFSAPEKFTDAKDAFMETEKGRDAILGQLKDYITTRAPHYLAEGQRLTITVTDVDLAGDFEPGRGSQWDDVRIVKDIYPPRINLSFQVTDADGNVVKSGTRKLQDMDFMMNISINTNDSLRFEKTMLNDWMSSEFKSTR